MILTQNLFFSWFKTSPRWYLPMYITICMFLKTASQSNISEKRNNEVKSSSVQYRMRVLMLALFNFINFNFHYTVDCSLHIFIISSVFRKEVDVYTSIGTSNNGYLYIRLEHIRKCIDCQQR